MKWQNVYFYYQVIKVFQADTVRVVPDLIDKDMVRELVSKIENIKFSGLSGVLSEMVKAWSHDHIHSKSDYSRC